MCHDVTGSSFSGNVLFFQAFVTDNGQRVVLPYKCVYGTRPVSTHPLGAIKCLMFVHVGSQD